MIGRLASTPRPVLEVFRGFAKGFVRHTAAPCVERRRERKVSQPSAPGWVARALATLDQMRLAARRGLAGRLSGKGRAARCGEWGQ